VQPKSKSKKNKNRIAPRILTWIWQIGKRLFEWHRYVENEYKYDILFFMKLDMIGIVVSDIPRSLAFYRLLGLQIPEFNTADNHVEIVLPNGLRFAWDKLEMMKTFDPTASLQPHNVGAFLCSSPEDVDSTHQRLLEAGYNSHKAPWDAFWGQRYAMVKDPDGHTVDLFAPL
jgi:uncharacterized glyoxalase superfamily protein PhnB